MTNIAVIYYSATGNVHALAVGIADGARAAGADVRLLRIEETTPAEAIAANERWAAHVAATKDLPLATLDDLEWADGVLFGTPTRFGNMTHQLKRFIDQTGGLWGQGKLLDKVVSGFTSAATAHGGLESTLLSLYNTFYSWGAIIVPPGYGDPNQFASGNPYGTSFVGRSGATPGEVELNAARYQGRRVAEIAARLKA